MEQRVVLGVSVGISQNGVHEEMPQQPLALFQRVGGIAGQQLGNALVGRIAFRGRRCCRVLASRFYAESLRAVFLMQPNEPPFGFNSVEAFHNQRRRRFEQIENG